MPKDVLTSAQCRRARKLLGWSIRDLWAKSMVSIGSISRVERATVLRTREPCGTCGRPLKSLAWISETPEFGCANMAIQIDPLPIMASGHPCRTNRPHT